MLKRVVQITVLGAAVMALFQAGAVAATSQSGTQSLQGSVGATLTATFPSTYSFGTFNIGATNTSTQQNVVVKSNKSWGVKINSDDASGLMREATAAGVYTGTGVLGTAMQFAITTPPPVGSAADLSSTPATLISSQAKTSNSGTTVGTTFYQDISFSDDPLTGSNIYQIKATYDASQGY